MIIIICIQPEGRFWQEPEPSQATGMALAHCILGSFLGVGCRCFPLPLDVLTFASRCLHVQATWETSISERRNYGREMAGQFCLWFRLPRKPAVIKNIFPNYLQWAWNENLSFRKLWLCSLVILELQMAGTQKESCRLNQKPSCRDPIIEVYFPCREPCNCLGVWQNSIRS